MTNATVYDISLRIRYLYDSPAEASRTLLRMLPRTLPGQTLVSGWVGTTPEPNARRDGADFFGNATTELAHDRALTEIAFRFDGRVQRNAVETWLDLSCGLGELAAEVRHVHNVGPTSPHHFLGTSPRVAPDGDIAAFAREVAAPDLSVLAAVEAVSRAIHGEFAFDPEATEVTTDPAEAFRNRHGVCQDFSHVMIAALRSLGIPAGYVSGFLRTIPPEGQPRLEGADAMHAWVRAWCGTETGWIEIDPTNDLRVGADHITVAHGRDYSDVAPVKGTLRSVGSQRTSQEVDVVPVAA